MLHLRYSQAPSIVALTTTQNRIKMHLTRLVKFARFRLAAGLQGEALAELQSGGKGIGSIAQAPGPHSLPST